MELHTAPTTTRLESFASNGRGHGRWGHGRGSSRGGSDSGDWRRAAPSQTIRAKPPLRAIGRGINTCPTAPAVLFSPVPAKSAGNDNKSVSTLPSGSPRPSSPAPSAASTDSVSSDHELAAMAMSAEIEHKLPPHSKASNFWCPVPILFLCKFPKCPVDTLPMTNPYAVLDHLRSAHAIVLDNVDAVMPYLERYLDVWANKLVADGGEEANDEIHADYVSQAFLERHSLVKSPTDILPNGRPIHILGAGSYASDATSTKDFDATVRQTLHREKLHEVLKIQARERSPAIANCPRKCIFCKIVCDDSREALFSHMLREHGFYIGLADNLVNIDEFLRRLEGRMADLYCIYCERRFKSAPVLRKHMRKKKHFTVNTRNQSYDQFYVINYADPGRRRWDEIDNDVDEIGDDDSDDTEDGNAWDDSNDKGGTDDMGGVGDGDEEEDLTMCLFDDCVFTSAMKVVQHLQEVHSFDIGAIKKEHGLDFYGPIRLINYIRASTSQLTCFGCSVQFSVMDELTRHYDETRHHLTGVPLKGSAFWSSVEHLFPSYEGDGLLRVDFEGDDVN